MKRHGLFVLDLHSTYTSNLKKPLFPWYPVVAQQDQDNNPTPDLQPHPKTNPSYPHPSIHHLQRLPEIICIEEAGKLAIHVDHMHIPLPAIPNNRLGILPLLIPLNVNAQASVDLQFQTNLIVDKPPLRIVASLHTLQFQLLQSGLQIRELRRESLGLDLQIRRRLGNAELLRVEGGNLGGVRGGGMRREGFSVVVV